MKLYTAHIKTVFLTCICAAFSFYAFAQNDFCGLKNTSFSGGEKLTFKVYYNAGFIWVHAGTSQFSITMDEIKGHKAYHVTATGKTAKSYEWFYKVRDKYETYIDKETMLPLKFLRNVNEGGHKIHNDVVFNQSKKEATSNEKVFSIPQCTQDVLSAIYYARNINYNKYKPGDKIPFNMFLDDKVYSLYIRYVGKEQITTRYGTFNAIKIAPLLIDGTMFSGGEKMMIWVSDDDNHLPLRVDSPIVIGSIKVDLMGYEGIRNPFSSIVN